MCLCAPKLGNFVFALEKPTVHHLKRSPQVILVDFNLMPLVRHCWSSFLIFQRSWVQNFIFYPHNLPSQIITIIFMHKIATNGIIESIAGPKEKKIPHRIPNRANKRTLRAKIFCVLHRVNACVVKTRGLHELHRFIIASISFMPQTIRSQ
jgi:hypothetical protein